MLRSMFFLVVVSVLLAPLSARAHPADEGGVVIEMLGAERDEATGDVSVFLGITNATGERATLRGVRATVGAGAAVLTTVRFLGVEVEREPRFFALDPGENRLLAPPEGRVLVRGVSEAEIAGGTFRLTLYFGPSGAPELLVRVGPLPAIPFPAPGRENEPTDPGFRPPGLGDATF